MSEKRRRPIQEDLWWLIILDVKNVCSKALWKKNHNVLKEEEYPAIYQKTHEKLYRRKDSEVKKLQVNFKFLESLVLGPILRKIFYQGSKIRGAQTGKDDLRLVDMRPHTLQESGHRTVAKIKAGQQNKKKILIWHYIIQKQVYYTL